MKVTMANDQRPDNQDNDDWIGLELTPNRVTFVIFVVFNTVALLCGLDGASFGAAFEIATAVSVILIGIMAWPTDPLP